MPSNQSRELSYMQYHNRLNQQTQLSVRWGGQKGGEKEGEQEEEEEEREAGQET